MMVCDASESLNISTYPPVLSHYIHLLHNIHIGSISLHDKVDGTLSNLIAFLLTIALKPSVF